MCYDIQTYDKHGVNYSTKLVMYMGSGSFILLKRLVTEGDIRFDYKFSRPSL